MSVDRRGVCSRRSTCGKLVDSKGARDVEILSWWTVPQAASRLGIAPVSAYRAIAFGRLRVVETPLGVLVDPASVEENARTRRPVRHKGERVAVAVGGGGAARRSRRRAPK